MAVSIFEIYSQNHRYTYLMGFFKICFLAKFMLNLTMKVMDQKRCVKEKRSAPWPQDFSGLDTQSSMKGFCVTLPPFFSNRYHLT